MKKRLLIQTIAYCFVIASMADDASHLFRKQATAQTAGFLACRNPAAEVTVQVLQRPIEITGETGRSVNENLVHYQVAVREGGSNGEIIENYGWASANEYTVGVVISDPGKVYVDPDMTRYDSIPVAEIKTTWGEHYEAKKQWESRAQKTRYSMNPLKQSDFVEHCQNSAKWAFDAEMARPGTVVTKEFHFPGEGHTVNIDAAQVPTLETMQTDSGMVNLTFAHEGISEAVQVDSGIINKDTLHSLAELLETGEDIAEVRQDMREKRHERKAKEQAERERKAAEEAERLRQQQLEEQRKKKDAQKKKKSDKKTSEVGGAMSTPTTQQGRSAGTNPASGTEPANTDSQIGAQQPAQPTVTIDFSPLDNCTSILNSSKNLIGSLAASMVEVAMSKGEEEYSKLKSQIASLPDGDRKQQLEQALEAKYAAFKEAKSYYE